MEYNELLSKMQEINSMINSGCDLSYIEENIKYALEAGKYYDQCLNSANRQTNEIIDCYSFFTKYFLVYMAKKYDKSFKYELFSNNEDTFYRNSDNSINISKNNIGKDFEIIVFKIIHEFRHKMQFDDMVERDNRNTINSIDNLMNIDPATILFIKEQATLSDSNLYKRNHDCYTMEHDANLFSLSECKQFFKTDLIEKVYSGELSNYVKAVMERTDLSDKEYADKQNFPIIYEEDYRNKKYMEGKNISETSLLSLIYRNDGKPKTYDEILKDKQKLIDKYKGQVIDMKTSTTDYEKWSSPKTSEQHIEEIYKLIVASDPILTMQEYFSKYNNLKGQLTANIWSNKINELLENCPQLVDMYSNEIASIFRNELLNGNKDFIQNVINNFPDKDVAKNVQSVITVMNMNTRSKSSTDTTDDEIYEENVPYANKTNDQDIINKSKKRREEIENLRRLQEQNKKMQEQYRKMQQEFIDNQEDLEEDQGMSL